MPINKHPSTPPPVIGKIGPYTVFMTPPATPKPPGSPASVTAKPSPVMNPPVQPPPPHFEKSVASYGQNGSALGFLRNAITKVQIVHSSVDDHLVRWFGLNQSKYQWALDEYYDSKGSEQSGLEPREMPGKVHGV